ncbi:response regulator [Olivibacter sp. XZL3]|uniref:response regulator n=1 Tax=Olivibacter sp. XZL3 TaxID=1735116 RepID=UPI001066423A|nr:response regulator [Olivibacter sp. XZL3]
MKTYKVRETEGTGVGLYLVKTYCEQLGWRPELVSSPESGTQVTIHLMLGGPSTAADFQETKDGERKKVLIVEDNQELSSFLKESLEPLYACAIVQNGRQALQMIDRHYLPDLIVSDAMMPVMDGLEMAKMLRKSSYTASVPIILLTAKNDERVQRERIAVGIDAFVSKPFDLELLKLQIRQLLDRKDRIMAQLRLDSLHHPKTEKELESPDELLLVKITRIIEEHIDDSELSVQLLSEHAAIGTKQLYRKIKQLTGFTPVEYIRTIRMKKAAILLKQRNFTVAEVMYMVGFTNASYFSKCFQAEFSLTPKHYMEQYATD